MLAETVPFPRNGGHGSAGADFFSLQFTATPPETRLALAKAVKQLGLWDLPEDVAASTEIALAEACNNIAEHAYAGRDPGPVWLGLLLQSTKIIVTLSDRGWPLSPDLVQSPVTAPDPSALPEGGFGWFLIKSLAQDLRIHRVNGTNHLTFSIPRTKSAS